MKQIISLICSRIYFWYRFPGWVLHELAHELFLFVFMVTLHVDFKSRKYSISTTQFDGTLTYTSHGKFGDFLAIIISYAPLILYLILTFVLVFSHCPLLFLIFMFYSVTTFWYFPSDTDRKSIRTAKQRLFSK